MLALGMAAGAHAQMKRGDQTVLPVVDNSSGKVQAYLVLEPTAQGTKAGARWRFGDSSLDAAFGLRAGDSLALLCDQRSGVFNVVGNLASNCQLASLGDRDGSRHASATAAFNRPDGGFGLTVGQGKDSLPAWLSRSGTSARNDVDYNDLTVFAQKNISEDAYVTIAGTIAKATLIPFTEAPADLGDRWSSKSLSVGGGYGAFSANVIGRVIETPGRPSFEGLGLGVTWRTPWSGQLTVGAENVVTRGRNPFSPNGETNDEGAVPYVRYEQDL
ncbi:MAG TPA: hypothetical protein PLI48_06530 [Gammaproteobacteria bacterium]|nr:hypothetical protein [Luteimonas sp.]HRO27692.1 hypothetical protein [Luteimonas sp.]HRP35525.1 hypothetical protein [Gammaproteobacteria bacterium]HRP71849.1 hypothetical protein [Luteimonas sp.]